MLKLLTDENVIEVAELYKNSLLGTRALCYARAYGCNSGLADFWAGDNVFIARFDDSFTLVSGDDADYGEIGFFLDCLGAEKITATQHAAEALKVGNFALKKAFVYNGQYDSVEDINDLEEYHFKEFYGLISRAIPGSFKTDKNAYLSFISDFIYRKRRGFARAKCILIENEVCATAMTASETDTAAVISGVSSDEKHRKSGLGKKIVLSLAQELKNEDKTVYVIALNESAEGFYKHIGFEENETIAFIDRKAK